MKKFACIGCQLALFLCVSLCLAPLRGWAQTAMPVSESMGAADLTPYLQVQRDPGARLTLAQLVAQPQDFFQQPYLGVNSFGFDSAAYWVRFSLRNDQGRPQQIYLRQDYLLIDYLDFWYQDNNGHWRSVETGDRRSFGSRAIKLRDFVFPISLPAHASATYYLRFKSDGPVNLGLTVAGVAPLTEQLAGEQLLYGAYYGGFLVLVIYNLILFFAVKDRAYVHYMIYVVSYGLYMSVHNGLSFQHFWPDSPWWANQSLVVFLGISLLFGMQFSRIVCASSRLAPRLDRLAWLLQLVTGSLLAVTLFVPYQYLIFAYSLQTVLVCVFILVLGFVSLLQNYSPARYFMVAWATLMLAVLVYMAKQFGLLPHNWLTQNSFQIGSLVEMVLLSLALGARVNEMQRLGFSDALTGLANRRHFDEQFPLILDGALRRRKPLSLIMLDIDYFKSINDQWGHSRGDEVLAGLGRLLRKDVRRPNLVARFGGEEFVLVLPGTDAQQAQKLAERLRATVEGSTLAGLKVTISLGLADLQALAHAEPSALFEAADSALYQAKTGGRNRLVVYQLPQAERREQLA